jgi:hypothetical protein
MHEETIADLEGEVERRRQVYLSALTAAVPDEKARGLPMNDTGSMMLLAKLALFSFDAQRAKVPYDEAVSRLESARARGRQKLADEAQTRGEQAQNRNEAMQRSMTRATTWIAVFTVIAALGAILALFKRS